MLQECYAIRKQTKPDSWYTFSILSKIGDAMLAQGKYAEAEPMLESAYQGMLERKEKIPAASRSEFILSISRLVKLYEAKEDSMGVKKWQQVLESQMPQ